MHKDIDPPDPPQQNAVNGIVEEARVVPGRNATPCTDQPQREVLHKGQPTKVEARCRSTTQTEYKTKKYTKEHVAYRI